jgi:hypothetical protein
MRTGARQRHHARLTTLFQPLTKTRLFMWQQNWPYETNRRGPVQRYTPDPKVVPLVNPSRSHLSAWLSPQGEGTVSILDEYNIARLHAFSDGRTKDRGHIYSDAVFANTDFSVTDRLAFSVGLPYITAKYVGSAPHLLVRGEPDTIVAVDNGDFHGGFQDFRLNVRYALTQHALKITPLFQATIPSHDYPTLGHAAIGVDETEYRVGVNVGRRLDPILPKVGLQRLGNWCSLIPILL